MESWRRLTECSICFERLNNSKCLPCSHTFCCKCLEALRSTFRYNGRKQLPCPLCRSKFDVPAVGCSKLPTNVYAEQLMQVGQSMEETETELKLLRNDYSVVKTQLEENLDEKCRLDVALAQSASKLEELEVHSSEKERQLKSRVMELERHLSAAESSKCCLRETQRKILETLKGE